MISFSSLSPVEIRIARLRALTLFLHCLIRVKVDRRNKDRPTEGIDTLISDKGKPFTLTGRNKDRPTEGIDTFENLMLRSDIVCRNKDRPTEGIDTFHNLYLVLSLSGLVEIRIARLRALTQHFFGPSPSPKYSSVEIRIARLRALTLQF